MSDNKVILIGLDGIDFDEIEEWLDDGTLATLSSFEENSTELESTHPPWTPCAWPSLLSGRNPGKHGVFDFFTRDGYEKRLIERADVDSPYIFDVADEEGLTSLVINYPVTHPPSNLDNGVIVPGYLAPEDVEFFPEGIRKEYEEEYGEYIIYPDYGKDSQAVEEYVSVARHRRDMASFLNDRYDWDVLAVQFQVTDSIFHDIDDRGQIRRVLERIDGFIKDIVGLGGEVVPVFIFSDHGMGDYDWTFYINSWLAENGYCDTTTGEETYFRQKKDQLKGKGDKRESSSIQTLIDTTLGGISRVGLSPKRIHRGLSTVGLAQIVERILPADVLVAAQNQVVDHENSTAYQLLFNSLGVHLNVKGRDPHGRVLQSEYDRVRDELIDELSKIRDPEGDQVFDEVLPREEVYSGTHVEDAPDILLIPREYRYDVSGSIVDTFRRYSHKNHKPEGILFSNCNLNVDPGEGASIYDIAPTVAAALGIPVDSNTDGEILGSFEADEQADWDELAKQYRERGTSDTDSDDTVEDRLADLGYLE